MFTMHPVPDGQTDRRTDGQTDKHHGKFGFKCIIVDGGSSASRKIVSNSIGLLQQTHKMQSKIVELKQF